MGWQPKNAGPAPSAESFHLSMARSAYTNGRIDVEEFEECVEHVLAGGCLDAQGRIPDWRRVLTANELRADLPMFRTPQMQAISSLGI
jgi:hypothetical protein